MPLGKLKRGAKVEQVRGRKGGPEMEGIFEIVQHPILYRIRCLLGATVLGLNHGC